MAITRYVWNYADDSYLMEKDESGVTTAVYTNEPVPYGNLISQRQVNTSSYYHVDAQQSTRQLTSATQDVTDTYTFAAYGEMVESVATTTNLFGYIGACGYCDDDSTQLIYVRARTLSPAVARWLSCDPLSNLGGNYVYTYNSPVCLVDPSGLKVPNYCCFDCRLENHHWLPRAVKGDLALKGCEWINIDHFCTPLERCWDYCRFCDQHGSLHGRAGGWYNALVRAIINNPRNSCCDIVLTLNDKVMPIVWNAICFLYGSGSQCDDRELRPGFPPLQSCKETGRWGGSTIGMWADMVLLCRLRNLPEPQLVLVPSVVPAVQPCPQPNLRPVIYGGAAGVGVGLIYLGYRACRLVPSFAPPLWWTLPWNFGIP